jgi:3'(2'), 5'-bisphosphate nucleotidase
MHLNKEHDIAVAAVREASELCRRVQLKLSESSFQKADRSPVTVAHFGSQALICSNLRTAFPGDPIIAEENADILRDPENSTLMDRVAAEVRFVRQDSTGSAVLDWIDFGGEKNYSDRFWTLDPIDGTKGFLRGDQYAIALALIEMGEVVLAAVGCPNLALEQTDGRPGVIMSAQAGNDPVRLDSQAKYAVVAAGNADVYLRLPSNRRYVENIWDHAGGALLVQEAGGTVTDVGGRRLDFSKGYQLSKNRGVIVSNGHVHDRLLKAIQEAGIS